MHQLQPPWASKSEKFQKCVFSDQIQEGSSRPLFLIFFCIFADGRDTVLTEHCPCISQLIWPVRPEITDGKKCVYSSASRPTGTIFGLSSSFWCCLELGEEGSGLPSGTHAYIMIAFWYSSILHSVCKFPISFSPASSNMWAKLAWEPSCSLRQHPDSSRLWRLPNKHNEYDVFRVVIRGVSVSLRFFSRFTDGAHN